ncbi:MAG TPA: hypothetical protein VGL09_17120 [Methylomirabilota bacterium]|jgi:hypothetical protein
MIKKSVSIFLATLMLVVFMAPLPTVAQAPTGAGAGLTVPVTGRAQSGGRVTGTFTIAKFVDTGDASNPIGAVGTLVLQLPTGQMATTQVTMPVQLASGGGSSATSGAVTAQLLTCEILDLTLGPLDLNLLGLVIHLDRVHLTIEANPAGGLLGQLLCAIANLLGPGGIITNLAQLLILLNQLLAFLGGL